MATPSDSWFQRIIGNPHYRALTLQLFALAVVIAVGAYLVHNAQTNLQQRGIASGFGFLSAPAGFGIVQHLVDYSEKHSYGRVFFVGLLNTLLVSVLGILLATLIGFIVGIARLSSNWLIAKLALVYVEIFRNIPLLLQIFFWYFAVLRSMPPPRASLQWHEAVFLNMRGLYLPMPVPQAGFWLTPTAFLTALVALFFINDWAKKRQAKTGQPFPIFLTGLGLLIGLPLLTFVATGRPLSWQYPELRGFNFVGGLVIIPELAALVLALAIYTAAFIAEVVRAGIQAVSRGQTEAAQSLGLSPSQVLRLIVIPQALRVIIPPLTNQYLNLTKNSSLGAAIAYPDLVSIFAGTVLNQTGQAIEVICITMAVYLSISITISVMMNWYNRCIALVER